MSMNLSWLLEKRIVYASTEEQVTVSELQDIVTAIADYIHQGDAPVHAILDFTNVERFPTRINAYKDFVFPAGEPNTGLLVVISANKLALFIMGVVAQLSERQIYAFPTLDEGLAFLARKDWTLPWFEMIRHETASL
ncbi:MAG: hypothetical protein GC204_00850 [Chloroflexi bacterium]|nr:hypothetical protein [Chloroflexota bacterium]